MFAPGSFESTGVGSLFVSYIKSRVWSLRTVLVASEIQKNGDSTLSDGLEGSEERKGFQSKITFWPS